MSDGLRELAAYLDAFEEAPMDGNIGLYARQNMLVPKPSRIGGVRRISALEAGFSSGFAAVPYAWASVATAEQAAKDKTNRKIKDVSGGEIVVVGKSQRVGSRTLSPGDQFFWQPATKKVEAIKTLSQLKMRTGVLSQEEQTAKANDPGRGNVWESATNLRAILRALEVNVPATGAADPELVQAWQRAANVYKLNPSVNAKTGDTRLSVSAPTLSALRIKARQVDSMARTPAVAATPRSAPAPVTPPAAASRYAPAPKGGTVVASVTELQQILKRIGYSKLVQDGKWGPSTSKAWQDSTNRRRLDPTIARADATNAWVYSDTLNAMRTTAPISTAARAPAPVAPTPTPVVPKSAPPAAPARVPGATVVNTADVQKVLVRLGSPKKGLTDGTFGKNTAAAYTTQAVKLGKDPLIGAAPNTKGKKVGIIAETWAALQVAASKPAPAATPALPTTPIVPATSPTPSAAKKGTPSKAGMVQANVGLIQDSLIRLGVKPSAFGKAGRDGLWGPKTATAWQTVAKKRKLDGTINRAGPMEAWVMPKTLNALVGPVAEPEKPKPQPDETKAVAPSAQPSALAEVPPKEVGDILKAFGKAPQNAAEAKRDWAAIAKKYKLDPTLVFEGNTLRAAPGTFERLRAEAVNQRNIAVLKSGASAPVSTLALQKALLVANVREGDDRGKFPDVKATGKMDTPTFDGFLQLFKVPAEFYPAWRGAKSALVSKDGKTFKMTPKMADDVKFLASGYDKEKAAIKAEKKKQEAEAKAVGAEIDRIVAASNTPVSVLSVQQAANEARLNIAAGEIKVPAGWPELPEVALTGTWDERTSQALLAMFSDKIWGSRVIPDVKNTWAELMRRLRPDPRTIRVPAEVANLNAELARRFVARGVGAASPVPEAKKTLPQEAAAEQAPRADVTREHLQPSIEADERPVPSQQLAPTAPQFAPDIPVPSAAAPVPSSEDLAPPEEQKPAGGSGVGVAIVAGGLLLALMMSKRSSSQEMPLTSSY